MVATKEAAKESVTKKCPIFPGSSQRLHWSFTDPSKFQGTHEEKLARVKKVKEEIRFHIIEWLRKNP